MQPAVDGAAGAVHSITLGLTSRFLDPEVGGHANDVLPATLSADHRAVAVPADPI